MGEGQNPTLDHLIKLGKEASLTKNQIAAIIDQTRYALDQWDTLSKNHGVSNTNIRLIKSRFLA